MLTVVRSTANMKIYTDGSCHGNPGKGGWALYCPETGLERWGSDERTTNNRMELQAIIEALQIEGVTEIVTDSDYCQKGYFSWSKTWVRNGWKTAKGQPVKNAGLWKKIVDLKRPEVKLTWVKAHATDEHNNYVDQLANRAAESKASPSLKELEDELDQLDKRRREVVDLIRKMRSD